jgi:hypothetical protein
MIFIDLNKAYDKITRTVMWWALEKHKVSTKYIALTRDMYSNVMASVCLGDNETNTFTMK